MVAVRMIPVSPIPCGRRGEQLAAALDDPHFAVGREQFQGEHVAGERSRAVVVLAVDIGADRAAHRDVAGARGHGDEPAQREEDFHQAVQ